MEKASKVLKRPPGSGAPKRSRATQTDILDCDATLLMKKSCHAAERLEEVKALTHAAPASTTAGSMAAAALATASASTKGAAYALPSSWPTYRRRGTCHAKTSEMVRVSPGASSAEAAMAPWPAAGGVAPDRRPPAAKEGHTPSGSASASAVAKVTSTSASADTSE